MKKILFLVISIFIIGLFACNNSNTKKELYEYELNKDLKSYTLVTARDNDGHIVVPEYFNNLPITSIADDVFGFHNGIKSIYISKNITYLPTAFLTGSRILEIVVDEKNSVYDSRNNCNCVIETKTNKIIAGCVNSTIPEGVEIIGARAFESAFMDNIVLPESLIEIEYAAFWDNDFEYVKIPNNVVKIGDYAFYDCNELKSISLSDSLIEIGDYVFSWCLSLTKLSIPASVQKIGENITHYCIKINEISVDENNIYFDSRDNCNGIIEKETKKLIATCLKTSIPTSIEIIGTYCFPFCYDGTIITIPSNITIIEDYVFYTNRGLSELVFEDENKWYYYVGEEKHYFDVINPIENAKFFKTNYEYTFYKELN